MRALAMLLGAPVLGALPGHSAHQRRLSAAAARLQQHTGWRYSRNVGCIKDQPGTVWAQQPTQSHTAPKTFA